MNLILELVARDGQVPGEEPRKEFGVAGGRIGRASDCDWVLRSPYISRYHATVCCIDGAFHIVSTSENGIALNDAGTMLPQLEHRALQDGDRLFIDEYEIAVLISEAEIVAVPSVPEATQEPVSLDPLRIFTPAPPPSTNTRPQEFDWNHSSGLADHFTPPSVALPADWDRTHLPAPEAIVPPSSDATVSVVATPNPESAFDLAAFLRSAGIDPGSLAPETAATLGRMLRAAVQGLIAALQTRADFRDQFRLPVTRVKQSENNPLKFAVDADDAWSSLLRRQTGRYLGPLDAIDDAFDDIRTHHLAMVVGIRAGFESVLNRFNPKTLAQEFDKRSRRSFLRSASLRYWRQYVELYEGLTAGEAQTTFRRLFGEEFAHAYERHLDTTKHQHGKP